MSCLEMQAVMSETSLKSQGGSISSGPGQSKILSSNSPPLTLTEP